MDNKSFIDKLSVQAGLNKSECASMIEALASVMEKALSEGDSISIPAFGNFESRKRNERIMASPTAPGKKMLVPPKVVVSFKTSVILKNKINNITEDE